MSKKRIGILGGGQLARMSAMQAIKMGFNISILDKEAQSPAGQLTNMEFIGSAEDKDLLGRFVDSADIITLENEFIDYHILEFIEKRGKIVVPSSSVISLIQDKLMQKKVLQQNGINVPVFIEMDDKLTYKSTAGLLGKKFVLKSRKMGYDGYGNHLVKDEASFEEGMTKLKGRSNGLLAEKFVNFEKELAVMVVRTERDIKTYPVVETIQKNHICHMVIAPAKIEDEILRKAQDIAVQCVKAVGGFGIFGVEMFLADGKLLVNEMAPRPHNSGHYTIEGCETSQFENHIRAVLNLPLGSTEMIKKHAVMINLLGKKNDDEGIENYGKILKEDRLHLHYYGKKESRPGRKMGHITVTGDNLEELKEMVVKAEQKIII